MKTSTLIGYFSRRSKSREAFKKLRRKAISCAAWVEKNRKGPTGEERRLSAIPFTREELKEHAVRLAALHRLDPKPLRDTHLLQRIDDGR